MKQINNERGYTFIGTLLVIFIIVSVFLSVFYMENLNNVNISEQGNESAHGYVSKLSAKERLHSKLSSNVSLNETTVSYPDLKEDFALSEVSQSTSTETLYIQNGGSFFINNKSDVHISLNGLEECSYNVQVLKGDYDLLEGSGNVYESSAFIINGNSLYDETTGETNYGEYTVTSDSGCFVGATVVFEKLNLREMNMKTKGYERNIIIDNVDPQNPIVKFK